MKIWNRGKKKKMKKKWSKKQEGNGKEKSRK